jgi:DNA-binding transcriptional ArsR family regulator
VEVEERRQVGADPGNRWTFTTKHAQVLLAIARDPELRVREIAECVQITERYVYRVLSDLQEAGYLHRVRRGRRNRYRVDPELALGDPVVEEQSTRGLLRLSSRSAGRDLLGALSPQRRSSRD